MKTATWFCVSSLLLGSGVPWLAQSQSLPVPAPEVQAVGPGTVEITWPDLTPGYILQESDSPAHSALWRGVLQDPVPGGGRMTVTRSLSDDTVRWFYRIRIKGANPGLDYLIATQSSSGAWGDPARTLSRDTAMALDALALYGQNNDAYYRGLSRLIGTRSLNYDETARKAVTLGSTGYDVSSLLTELLAGQGAEVNSPASPIFPGRGWGLHQAFGSNPLDTALVIRALKTGGMLRGLTVVNELVPAASTAQSHVFNVPAGAGSIWLKIRSVSGATLRFRLTPPGSTIYSYADVAPQTTTLNIGPFPSGEGDWTFAVQNLGGTAAAHTTEIGFTTSDGFDVFRCTSALMHLGLTQNADGGWGIARGEDSHLMITAEVLRSLALCGNTFIGPQPLGAGVTWLRNHQNPDGGFSSLPGASNPNESSLAAMAIRLADPAASLRTVASYLRGTQLPDGSWANDPYQTATVVQALRLPPVVSSIPSQTVSSPTPFVAIHLDDYVTDPDHTDAEITWTITGNSQLSVSIVGHVASITYPADTSVTEQLTFTATDPDGFSASSTAAFSVSFAPNQPPVISAIPGQSIVTPDSFTTINLDHYVVDPDNPDSQITWAVTGNNLLTVTVVDRVATIAYPPSTTSSFTELLTFTATDPGGLSSSTAASFSVVYDAIDYIIARGGSVDDFRTISASEDLWSQAASISYSYSAPPSLTYGTTGLSFSSATDLRVDYHIAVGADATVGTVNLQVDHQILDAGGSPLGPLTGNVFNFRIQVTP